jgi:hypothetical protein
VQDPAVQFKLNEQTEVTVVEVEGDADKAFAIQYFVGTFVGISAGQPPEGDPSDDKLVATVAATFLVRYLSDTAPTQDMLQAFNDNAVHHAWPYWREYLSSVTTRLRVPTVVLPVRVSVPSAVSPGTLDGVQSQGAKS